MSNTTIAAELREISDLLRRPDHHERPANLTDWQRELMRLVEAYVDESVESAIDKLVNPQSISNTNAAFHAIESHVAQMVQRVAELTHKTARLREILARPGKSTVAVAALQSRCEAAEKDAARYAHLRDKHGVDVPVQVAPGEIMRRWIGGQLLDEATDAAIAAAKEQKP